MKNFVKFLKSYFYSIVTFPYLMTVGTLDSKNRTFIHEFAERFGLESDTLNERLSETDVSELPEVNNQSIRVIEEQSTEGNIRLSELIVINKFVGYKDPRRIFEFGTFDGRTTINLAVNSNDEAEIYTIDLPPDRNQPTQLETDRGDDYFISKSKQQAYRYENYPESDRIEQIHCDSATFDYDQLVENFDFIFVDGAHSYEYVKSDSQAALDLINDEGVILWHDYGTFKGVTDFLNESYASDDRFNSLRRITGTSLVYLDREKQ